MSKKNKANNFPSKKEVKEMKDNFKKMIDEMPDEDFIDLLSFFMLSSNVLEDSDWEFDEGWEDEAERFYNESSQNFKLNDEDIDFFY